MYCAIVHLVILSSGKVLSSSFSFSNFERWVVNTTTAFYPPTAPSLLPSYSPSLIERIIEIVINGIIALFIVLRRLSLGLTFLEHSH